MNEFFQRNLTLKVISMLLAILLWVYVSNVQNPIRQRVFNSIPLTYIGLGEQLSVVKMPESVTVQVQGNEGQINSLAAKDLIAYVDLKGVGSGTNNIDAKVSVPAGVQVIRINPGRVPVTIDALQIKQVAVKVKYTGKLARDFQAMEPVIKPQKVVLRGPQQQLQDIQEVYVTVDLKNASKNILETLPVQFGEAKDGRGYSNVTTQPGVVEVLIPVTETLPTKNVAIKPVFKGQPASGYRVEGVVSAPDYVTIVGPSQELERIAFLETTEIDLSGKNKNFRQEVNLKIPKGIRLAKGERPIVIVQIGSETKVETLQGVPVEIKNAAPNNQVTINPLQVDVSWSGKADPELSLWVDVANLPPGVHDLVVQTKHHPDMQVLRIVPEHISVTVE